MAQQAGPLGVGARGAQESKGESDRSTLHRCDSEEGREVLVYYVGIPRWGRIDCSL
jgi:hypothetical protein